MALRPAFSVDVAMPSRALITELAKQLAAGPMSLKRTRRPGGGGESSAGDADHLLLTVPPPHQTFWSPWMTIEISPRGDGAHVHAKFSPHPSVWTGFAFGYLTMTVVLAVSLVAAATTFIVPGGQLWVLWISAAASLGLVGLWLSSVVGQRLAQAQMAELRTTLDHALAACVPA